MTQESPDAATDPPPPEGPEPQGSSEDTAEWWMGTCWALSKSPSAKAKPNFVHPNRYDVLRCENVLPAAAPGKPLSLVTRDIGSIGHVSTNSAREDVEMVESVVD